MKKFSFFLLLSLLLLQCKTVQQTANTQQSTVAIENDSIQYDIIVTDIGFEKYLTTIAKPKDFYSKEYYEFKNRLYVPVYNQQVRSVRSGKWIHVFEQQIEYDPNIDYGLDVNYKLYNYFKFLEYTYKFKLF